MKKMGVCIAIQRKTSRCRGLVCARPACRVECPVEAIFHEDSVAEQLQEFVRLNANMAGKTPSITERNAPLV
jgi:hypothetical protein